MRVTQTIFAHKLNITHNQQMKMIMKLDNLNSIEELENFLDGSQPVVFAVSSNKIERYRLISKLLSRFNYYNLKRSDKSILIKFLLKMTGYSISQLERLIAQHKTSSRLVPKQKTVNGFERIYNDADLTALIEIDKAHDTPNGLMVKKICERAYLKFDDNKYKRLSTISVSHIYNLRSSSAYKNIRCHYEKTKSKKGVKIGVRKKPINNGKPGYIRIDTVHQGDLDGNKGVYHINAVDEVTQYEIVVSVEKISEAYLIPALETLLESFPFKIINFHSDNGSEYVNKTVAKLLSKLLIEFTKSRPRKSNDNALAEGKNAAIVRKTFGYIHIPQHFAKIINKFNMSFLNPYINYHRPCLYPTTIIDKKGKQKKIYNYEDMETPYEKFKSLDDAKQYLKEDITFKILDDLAYQISDNEAAKRLQTERSALFRTINENCLKIA